MPNDVSVYNQLQSLLPQSTGIIRKLINVLLANNQQFNQHIKQDKLSAKLDRVQVYMKKRITDIDLKLQTYYNSRQHTNAFDKAEFIQRDADIRQWIKLRLERFQSTFMGRVQFEKQKNQVNTLIKQQSSLEDRLLNLTHLVKHQQTQLEKFNGQIQLIRESNDQLQRQNSQRKANFMQIQYNYLSNKRVIQDIYKKADEQRRNREQLQQIILAKQKEARAIVEQQQQLFNMISTLSISYTNLSTNFHHVQQSFEELKQIETLQNQQRLKSIKNLQQKYIMIESQIQKIMKKAQQKNKQNLSFKCELKNVQQRIQKIKKTKIELKQLYLQSNSMKQYLKKQLQGLPKYKQMQRIQEQSNKMWQMSQNTINEIKNYINHILDQFQKEISQISKLVVSKPGNQQIEQKIQKSSCKKLEQFVKSFNKFQQKISKMVQQPNFETYKKQQTKINQLFYGQNIVARWICTTGQVRQGNLIVWDRLSINTLPENFLLSPKQTQIQIVNGGIYEINCGVYSKKKPTVQILVNMQPIMSAVNNSSQFLLIRYVIHHSSGKLKDIKHPLGNITGITVIDFIMIPSMGSISVCLDGGGGQGFLSLKRL